MKQNADVCVVGGGIIGLCSALRLQSEGVSVLLVDAATIGSGASFGNAGHLAVEQVYPVADAAVLKHIPQMLLDPLGALRIDWHYLPQLMPWALQLLNNMRPQRFAAIHAALKNINGISLQAWQQFAEKWDLQDFVRVAGSLLCCETEQGVAHLQAHGKKLANMGIETAWLPENALREREPHLAHTQKGALLFPQTGHIVDLPAVMNKIRQHFSDLGGEIVENCRVLDIQHRENGVILQTEQGQIQAQNVLVATGAFSKNWVQQSTGVNVPLDTERGYHLMLPNEINKLSIPVTSLERRFIMTPMNGGLRLAGTVEYAGLHAAPNMNRARNLLHLAQSMFEKPLNSNDNSEWMGFRPTTADSLPVIDKVGRVLLNFGHQHLGLTQAVASANILADHYFGRQPEIDGEPYRLARFGTPKLP